MDTFLKNGNYTDEILMVALILVMIVVLAAVLVVQKAMQAMVRVTMPQLVIAEKQARQAARASRRRWWVMRWNRLMGLRPIVAEKEILMDHEYDGIAELDNPIPIWFSSLFYGTIMFAAVYLCVYHVFGWGPDQHQEYAREIARAEEARKAWLEQAANLVDEHTVATDQEPETIAAGQAIYTQHCVACHGQAGEGGIGPNLTDDYWLHGGTISDVFRTIKYGVLDKGMVPWEQNLTPVQLAQVSNYILSLRGTNPPNAKEPQGEKMEYGE